MQIEKTVTTVIIALGIIGSASLALAGRVDQAPVTPEYGVMKLDPDALAAMQLVNHSQDSLSQLLGM